MSEKNPFALIVPENFIQATRDSGYKSLASALAELVDNSFEAKATEVLITLERMEDGTDVSVVVADNGRGMDASTLRHALQFGWSSRFNQRDSSGRYGMGLPNASLSHAKRVELWSSQDGKTATRAYLDVDEIVTARGFNIPPTSKAPIREFKKLCQLGRGTVVAWYKCDRLAERRFGPLTKRLRAELGRLFRYQLWSGKHIAVNSEPVVAIDPLFERSENNQPGAVAHGPELTYEVELPGRVHKKTSIVRVRFTELPVRLWHSLSNDEKNARGIAKNAGVSIVRAGREIDRGWFFMGQKRKENYDDWWRCEVRFDPELDELFGVTHTKQEIHPAEKLDSILSPDLERIARELNARARYAFMEVKNDSCRRDSEAVAERFDNLIEPPKRLLAASAKNGVSLKRGGRGRVAGLEYRLKFMRLDSPCFFQPELDGVRLTVILNDEHPFVKKACSHMADAAKTLPNNAQKNIELMILAAARAEVMAAKNARSKKWTESFRQSWSNVLTTFLS